jgi:LysM repeat protein
MATDLIVPTNVVGVINADGGVKLSWDAATNAKAYVVHYGDANVSDPKKAIYMGYTETTAWTLAAADVPKHTDADGLYFYVQAYGQTGTGADDIAKAQSLNADTTVKGTAWSAAVVLDKLVTPTKSNSIAQIASWLDAKGIDHTGAVTVDDLLALTVPVVHVTGATLDQSDVHMTAGSTIKFTQTVTPADAKDTSGTWSVSDTSLAIVEDGAVTVAIGATGSFDVQFTTTDGGITATAHVTIDEPEPQQPEKYVVQPGDDIAKVATAHGVSVGWLRYVNNISGFTLKPGRTITFDIEVS